MIECYECGREISNNAVACPHCGAPKDENGDIVHAQSEMSKSTSVNLKKSDKERFAGWLSKKLNPMKNASTETSVKESTTIPPKLASENPSDYSSLTTPKKQLIPASEDSGINVILIKKSKVSILSIGWMILFLVLLSTLKFKSEVYPELTLVILISAVIVYRDFFKRRTYKMIIERKSLDDFQSNLFT